MKVTKMILLSKKRRYILTFSEDLETDIGKRLVDFYEKQELLASTDQGYT